MNFEDLKQQQAEGSDTEYWHELIDENEAAYFLDLSSRTLQGMRSRGDGPQFIRILRRCIRYRRIELKEWADTKLRNSTSDLGQGDSK